MVCTMIWYVERAPTLVVVMPGDMSVLLSGPGCGAVPGVNLNLVRDKTGIPTWIQLLKTLFDR